MTPNGAGRFDSLQQSEGFTAMRMSLNPHAHTHMH